MEKITIDQAVSKIPHGKESLAFINWVTYGCAIFLCTFLCLLAARYISEEDYWHGKIALIAAAIAGAAPQLAKLFLFN